MATRVQDFEDRRANQRVLLTPITAVFSFGSGFELVARAKTPEAQAAIHQELINQKKAEEEELAANLRAACSKAQYQRLLQITAQQKLRNHQYADVLSAGGKNIDEPTKRKLEQAARQAKREMDFARMQLAIDLNAKSFDVVAKTNLSTSLGKLGIFVDQSGWSRQGNPLEQSLTAIDAFGERYGTAATTELRIPPALMNAPEQRIEWNPVEVPDGWILADAMENLKKRNQAIQQLTDANQKWSQARDDLRKDMIAARRNGEQDLAKALQDEYAREYGGRGYFETRDQFREAMKIAQEDMIEARRMVKKLGGDPGELPDMRQPFF